MVHLVFVYAIRITKYLLGETVLYVQHVIR